MPCYDERNEPAFVRAEAQREWLHNSPVAELLCTALKNIPLNQRRNLFEIDQRLAVWWADHKRRDAAKLKRK